MSKEISIALAGNPNSGKSTLFNALTGARQSVGNWPGVTVEKKTGRLKADTSCQVVDLPGIYSLAAGSVDEIVARDYLVSGEPAVILNIVDGSNLERNLYLTTQLCELGLPVVIAVNMMDVVKRTGDEIDLERLASELSCPVLPISALLGEGLDALTTTLLQGVRGELPLPRPRVFSAPIEEVLAEIENLIRPHVRSVPGERSRLIALFEGDEHEKERLNLPGSTLSAIEKLIADLETRIDDDAVSLIGQERYQAIQNLLAGSRLEHGRGQMTLSDRIDQVVTNRILALPIFAAVMFLVYYLSVSTVGGWWTDWANDGLFGDGFFFLGRGREAYDEQVEEFELAEMSVEAFEEEAAAADLEAETATGLVAEVILYNDSGVEKERVAVSHDDYLAALDVEEPDPAAFGPWVPGVPVLVEQALEAGHVSGWLHDLVLDGIVAGVGAVLGFVPQMLVLFFFLALLEACGYMARIAFVMDRIFRSFGLSGTSFIPMLVSTGCAVPGIMAARTIESERDRRLTVATTPFMPCSAKLPVIALIAGALFDDAWWVAPSAYFAGIGAILVSGIILKKFRAFAGDAAPFVLELPSYRLPRPGDVLRSMLERAWSFIKRAGSIILLAQVFVWFTTSYGWADGAVRAVEQDQSFLAVLGSAVSWIFAPLGWGHWQAVVATITGLIAKENVVGTFGTLYGGFSEVSEAGWEIWANMRVHFTTLSAYSFLLFNLLCLPCFAAIGAIRREMNSARWTLFAIAYQTGLAYAVSLIFYQLGAMFSGTGSIPGTVTALVLLAGLLYLLLRPNPNRRLLPAAARS
ncbi:MAG: ferrous iron transporter B [Bacillota bacterium]|nr:ferrous iron transporter B [Bacillota bacterium]